MKWRLSMVFLTIILFIGISCHKEVESKPNFIFKKAPNTQTAAKILGKDVSYDELHKGIESDIYEAEMKVYELKMNRLRALVLERLMAADPRKKGMSNDEFLDKHIATEIKIKKEEIDAFIKKRQIPAEHINDVLKGRIEKFLVMEKKKVAVDAWISSKTSKQPVEVYLNKPQRPVFKVVAGNSPSMGAADAKVTVVEFSDFQCPFCAKGADVVTELKKKYGNKVKVVFKNFPLPFHNHAEKAAQAGLCAHDQGKDNFWKMHDKMFADQAKLDESGLKETAKAIGLKLEAFEKCLTSNKFKGQVAKEMEEGRSVGVKSTPTFFVNGQMVNGAQPIEVFAEIIDEELKK